MKNRISLIAIVMSVGWVGIAATGQSDAIFYRNSPVVMDVNAGILSGEDDAMMGVSAQVRGRLAANTRLYLGGEVGAYFYETFGTSGVTIPVQASLSTSYAISNRVDLSVGVSAGPTFTSGDFYDTTRFALFLNPGVVVDLGSNLAMAALARFGVLGGEFVALPQLGLLFAI